jgi:hypothetical protein
MSKPSATPGSAAAIVSPRFMRDAAQSRSGDGVGLAAAFIVRNHVSANVEFYRKFLLSHAK